MVIIDEAHYLRNPETKSAQLGKLMRSVSDNLLMLSATPIQMKSRDLFQLLHLLDEDTFSHETQFDMILDSSAPLNKLRDTILARNIRSEEFSALIHEARNSAHPSIMMVDIGAGTVDSALFDIIEDEEDEQLSVAYGLSWHMAGEKPLGKFVRSLEIPAGEPIQKRQDWESNFITKDDV